MAADEVTTPTEPTESADNLSTSPNDGGSSEFLVTGVDSDVVIGGTDETADVAPEVLTALEETIARLSIEGDALRQQLDDQKLQFQRLAADFDNFRKRTQREKDELSEQAKCLTLTELLPVVDNFERARAHITPQTDAEEKIHRSYQGVYKQLVECLKSLGVAAMRPEGKPFDPALHEAVMREESNEYPEGTVLEQLVRGYVLGERVLRHAMVKVSIPGDGTPSATPADPASAPSE